MSSIAQCGINSSAGLDLGGNGSLLITDPGVGAFGLGAGLQGSAFFKMWNDRPIGGKFRLESVSLKQESIQKSGTDYLLPGTNLKSLSQTWTLLSVGPEGRFSSQGQSFFWEALVGYAFGGASTVTLSKSQPDQPLIDTSQTTSSGFVVSGGFGIKKEFSKTFSGFMSLRTMFLLAPTYSSQPLASKTFIPVPLLFSIGGEFPFIL